MPDLSSGIDGHNYTIVPPAGGPAAVEPASGSQAADLDALVDTEKLRLLFAKAVYPYVSSIVKGGLYAAIVWHHLPRARVLGWLGAIIAVATGRLIARAIFFERPRGVADTTRWSRIATSGAAINGVLWGAAPLLVYVPGDLPSQLLLALVVALMITGANAFNASHRISFFAYVLPAALPLVARFLLEPDWPHRLMGLVFLNFTVASITIGWLGARAWTEHIQLRFRLALLTETLESRVTERTAELRTALSARDEFLLVASHELRTPITSMRLSAQFLERLSRGVERAGASSEAVARSAATIVRQSRHLGELFDQMLDVSRIHAGSFEVARDAGTDLAEAARAAAARLDHERARTGPELVIDAPSPVVGCWDRGRLEQVVTNLLINAIKFGCGKQVAIRVSSTCKLAHLSVVDLGLGISRELQARIFDRFERGVSAQHYGGLGLGLYIARQIVEAYGGTISVSSAPGCGAAFTVSLPCEDAGPAAQPKAPVTHH
jgi:signal transduction histidine kinase